MEKEFAKVVGLATGQNAIISLNLDKDGSEILALVKDVQYHPVTDKLLHVDFYRISLRDKITVSVAVVVTGESLGVKKGGILEHILWQVEVECLPTQIPDRIEVDITALNIGDTVHVKDLKLGEGINILTEGEQTILSVVPPTVVKEEEEVAEEKAAEPERIGGKEKEESVEEGKASKSEERKEEGSEKKAPKK